MYCILITSTNHLVMSGETITIYSTEYLKPINEVCTHGTLKRFWMNTNVDFIWQKHYWTNIYFKAVIVEILWIWHDVLSFLLNINRVLTVPINIDDKGHSRAMAFQTRSCISLKWCCLRQEVKSRHGTRPVEALVLGPVQGRVTHYWLSACY